MINNPCSLLQAPAASFFANAECNGKGTYNSHILGEQLKCAGRKESVKL